MFQFPRLTPCFFLWCHIFNMTGLPIRKSTDQFVYANPRSLSQLITSFIVSQSQGIHHVPLITYYYFLNDTIFSMKISVTYLILFTMICQRTFSGEYRIWTDDLLLAKQALYPTELIPPFLRSLARIWTAYLYIISVALSPNELRDYLKKRVVLVCINLITMKKILWK